VEIPGVARYQSQVVFQGNGRLDGIRQPPALAAPPRNPPLPPPRPNLEAPAAPAKTPQPPQAQAPDPTPRACAAIENGRALGESLPPISGDNGCGVSSPVRIHGVKLKSGVKLKLTPDAVLNCEMAGVVADFLDEEVARIAVTAAFTDLDGRPRRIPADFIAQMQGRLD